MEKNCENCAFNVSPMCIGKATGICDEVNLWRYKPDYQTLESQLEQYKRALRLACNMLSKNVYGCPDDREDGKDFLNCKKDCMPNIIDFTNCWVKYYLTKAKGG